MLIVLRRKETAFDVISVNAMGFVGSLVVKNTKEFQLINKVKPINVLFDVTFP